MGWLRARLDAAGRHFEGDGKLRRLRPVYEMVDTILYTPGGVTGGPPHVRDALDLKRMMAMVVVALIPCVVFGVYNTGLQAHLAIEAGAAPLQDLQTAAFDALGFSADSTSVLACLARGSLYYVPILLVTFLAGGAVEVTMAIVRGHDINEGFLVTGMLVPLILPATIPLWQLALGVGFGTLFGKEVFGGTGMNFLNPALVARAFLFFAYPSAMIGDLVWVAASFDAVAIDAVTGATPLSQLATDASALARVDVFEAFVGRIPGSIGETSTLACLAGGALLVATRIASLRTMVGVTLGTLVTALLLNQVGSDTNPMFAVPFHVHVVLGGWAFGAVFMATDPVSSAFTDRGKLVYGALIGVLIVLVRVVNPAYPEGTMLAILFMNMFAPLIDHFVVRANVARRRARHAR